MGIVLYYLLRLEPFTALHRNLQVHPLFLTPCLPSYFFFVFVLFRTLESKGFILSRTKTEYMMCDFSATRHEGGDVSLDGQVWSRRILFGI